MAIGVQLSPSTNSDTEPDEDEDIVIVDPMGSQESKGSRDKDRERRRGRERSKVGFEPEMEFPDIPPSLSPSGASGEAIPPPPPPAVPMPPGSDDLNVPLSSRPKNKRKATNRPPKQTVEDDIVMVEPGGPSEDRDHRSRGLKRSEFSAKKGFGGMIGGFLGKAMGGKSEIKESRRRSVQPDEYERRDRRRDSHKTRSTDEPEDPEAISPRNPVMSGGSTEEDREARRETRRAERHARRAEQERATEEARRVKDEQRLVKRRRAEEAEEQRRQEDLEVRRAARRELREKQAKEAERAERHRLRAEERMAAEREKVQTDADIPRLKRSDRGKTVDMSVEEDEERRRRREERRAAREAGEPIPRLSRRATEPPAESYFDSRHAEKREKAPKRPGWPHSGTDSWVKEHSDAPPPPEDEEPIQDELADPVPERKSRRSSRYVEDMPLVDPEERRRRREARRTERQKVRSQPSSQGDGRERERERGRDRDRDKDRYREREEGRKRMSREPSQSGGGSWWNKIRQAV